MAAKGSRIDLMFHVPSPTLLLNPLLSGIVTIVDHSVAYFIAGVGSLGKSRVGLQCDIYKLNCILITLVFCQL